MITYEPGPLLHCVTMFVHVRITEWHYATVPEPPRPEVTLTLVRYNVRGYAAPCYRVTRLLLQCCVRPHIVTILVCRPHNADKCYPSVTLSEMCHSYRDIRHYDISSTYCYGRGESFPPDVNKSYRPNKDKCEIKFRKSKYTYNPDHSSYDALFITVQRCLGCSCGAETAPLAWWLGDTKTAGCQVGFCQALT